MDRSGRNSSDLEDDDDNDDDEESSDTEDDDEVSKAVEFLKKRGKKKKKVGRHSQWPDVMICELVDVILNDEELKKKLIFTNSKNVRNSQWYADVITELKARNPEFNFSVKQTREKFKRCVTKCRTAAMIIKTKSGIKRFQEDKGYGTWFSCLYPVISTMDHCQPEQAIEPGHMPVPADDNDTIAEAAEEPAEGSV